MAKTNFVQFFLLPSEFVIENVLSMFYTLEYYFRRFQGGFVAFYRNCLETVDNLPYRIGKIEVVYQSCRQPSTVQTLGIRRYP